MGIAELFSKCSELASQEQKKLDNISRTMLPILAWLNEPVPIKSKSAASLFPDFVSLTLHPGSTVVMVDSRGKASSRPLAGFGAVECLAILEGALAEFQRLVQEKKEAVVARPVLKVKVALSGAHLLVDLRTYRLLITNSGGDCHGLAVSVHLPGGEKRTAKPCDILWGESAEVDLGVFKELGTAKDLKMELECEDSDGRKLVGMHSLSVETKEPQEAPLRERRQSRSDDD